MIETSGRCAAVQKALGDRRPAGPRSLGELPGGLPVILIANELLDCLPARQFVRTATGWIERLVGLGEDGAPAPSAWSPPRPRPADARDGADPRTAPRPRRRWARTSAHGSSATAARRC